MNPGPSRVHVLLTATVDVGGVGQMQRSDPGVRLRDYQKALAWWDGQEGPEAPASVTVCENSGTDIAPAGGGAWRRLRVCSWPGQDFPRHLGKGHGEMQTIATALARHADGWNDEDWLVKCNGRYTVPSVGRFCRHLRGLAEVSLVADMTRDLQWCDSRFFAARVSCWRRHIVPMLPRIDDSRPGAAFEFALAQAAHALMAEGGRFALLPFIPRIIGVSGSMGHSYRSPGPALKLALKQLLYPLKRAAFRV